MAVPAAYTVALSFTALLCTALSLALAYKRDHRSLCVGYAISACFNIALVISSMLAIWSDRAVLNRAISAFLCLSIGANPLIQSEHLNKILSTGSQPRSLKDFHWGSFLKGFHLRSSLKKFNLRSFLKEQYVLVYIWFSRVAAIGKVVAAAMLALCYPSTLPDQANDRQGSLSCEGRIAYYIALCSST
ncbi:hypothetical protein B0J12DRAFT_733729 [Macrophomina phaseolina]|uniref:Uncharacterized protein n=1 Tax=Macrophomina phaseolina TaxID=35725 RepID=A0ABQ8FQB5_9PEZI|nr:hypothetical protein B0J12DRAFT_733729 [Macrophomina phaseolina]